MLLSLLALACTPSPVKVGDDSGGMDSAVAPLELRVVEAPAGELLIGAPLSVTVELVRGGVRVDEPLEVTLRLDGEAAATANLVAGVALVSVPATGCRTVDVSVDAPTAGSVAVGLVAVAPGVTASALPLAVAAGLLPPLEVQLTDVDGAPVMLDGLSLTLVTAAASPVSLGGTLTEPVAETGAVFDAATAAGAGLLDLAVRGADGCGLDAPLGRLLVGSRVSVEPTFLPAARVGADYLAALPVEPTLWADPPEGLAVSGATVAGSPTTAAAAVFEVAALDADVARLFLVHLPVLPGQDADLLDPPFAPELPGPWPTDAVELTIPSVTVSHGTYRSVAVRVTYPSDGAGGVAEGAFPVIAFHHAAHSPSDIYDRYTDLHQHWASHGVIVASVDSHVNVDGHDQSWQNLADMSVFQLAAADLLRHADPTSPYYGHVDATRVVVAGHSRGGGASLLSLWSDPTLFGAILFEPVSPLQTPNQDWDRADLNGDRPLPVRPILLFVGAEDMDEPWPLPDVSFEQMSGPALRVTLHGANHEDTYDADTPGRKTSTSTIAVTARHDVDQAWSTAFLYRFGVLGDPAGDLDWDRRLFGAEAGVEPLAPEGITVQGRRFVASALDIDTFPGGPDDNDLGGPNVDGALLVSENDEPYAEGLESVGRYDERGVRIGSWAHARHVAWEDPDAELALFLAADGAPFDLTSWSELLLRVERDCPPPFEGACPDQDADLDVAIWDAEGREASVPLGAALGDRGIVGRHFGMARLGLDGFAGVDLERVEGVALRFGALDWSVGDLWVDDVSLE